MAERVDWQAWLVRQGPAALLYARQLTSHFEDAEDAVHEGFVRFWRRRTAARDPRAFFFACVRSAALDQRRGESRRKRREQDRAPELPQFQSPADGLARRDDIERALAALPQAQREVVVLKLWGGLTLAEVAENLSESPNTVAARYRSGMQKLSALLTPEVNHER